MRADDLDFLDQLVHLFLKAVLPQVLLAEFYDNQLNKGTKVTVFGVEVPFYSLVSLKNLLLVVLQLLGQRTLVLVFKLIMNVVEIERLGAD